jgi:hypothetical protein
MASPSAARAWAKKNGARYVDLRGGHFALLLQRDEAKEAILRFLND